MAARAIDLAVLLCLFAAGSTAGEIEDWSDAPTAWIVGLDRSAFCNTGAWNFDSRGEFVIISERPPAPPAHLKSDDAFFYGYYKGLVQWSPEGPVVEELTTFEIRRGAERGLTMDGFIDGALAISHRFETVLTGWLWERKVDAATCEGGEAPLIEIRNTRIGCCGGERVFETARLAAAGDGALIVRFDSYTCYLCLSKKRKRTYARFPAMRVASNHVSQADEAVQAPER